MADANVPTVSIQTLAGSLLAACILNWCLFGVLLVQIYVYRVAFPEDKPHRKVLVYGIFTFELVQTVIITRDIFAAFVDAFGNASALDDIHAYWFTIPVSGGIAGFIGQTFFAHRITTIPGNECARAISIFILILAVISGCASLFAAAQFHNAGSFSALNNNSLTSVGIWNGIGALCDIIIAVFMPYLLLRASTGISQMHDIITGLFRFFIEAGAFTAIISIAHLIFYFTRSSSSQLFIIFGVIISKVYSNTVMVLLNHRIQIRKETTEASTTEQDSANFTRLSRICVNNERMTVRLDDSSKTSQTSISSRNVDVPEAVKV